MSNISAMQHRPKKRYLSLFFLSLRPRIPVARTPNRTTNAFTANTILQSGTQTPAVGLISNEGNKPHRRQGFIPNPAAAHGFREGFRDLNYRNHEGTDFRNHKPNYNKLGSGGCDLVFLGLEGREWDDRRVWLGRR